MRPRPSPGHQAQQGPNRTPSFLALDGLAQQRYEHLRAYALLGCGEQARTTPARFSLQRFQRFGLLGLLDRDPMGQAWGTRTLERFQVEVIPVGTGDSTERAARLYTLLYDLITAQGEEHDTSRPLRPGLYRTAREGGDDPEPVGRHRRVR
ncbi:MAG: hypothetical protein ACE5IZ_05610 [Dehalococcoidia bacterium]